MTLLADTLETLHGMHFRDVHYESIGHPDKPQRETLTVTLRTCSDFIEACQRLGVKPSPVKPPSKGDQHTLHSALKGPVDLRHDCFPHLPCGDQ